MRQYKATVSTCQTPEHLQHKHLYYGASEEDEAKPFKVRTIDNPTPRGQTATHRQLVLGETNSSPSCSSYRVVWSLTQLIISTETLTNPFKPQNQAPNLSMAPSPRSDCDCLSVPAVCLLPDRTTYMLHAWTCNR